MRVKLTDAICSQKPPKERLAAHRAVGPADAGSVPARSTRPARGRSRAMPRDADGIQRRVSFKPRYPLLSLAEARQRVRDLEIQRQQGAPLPTPPPKTPRADRQEGVRELDRERSCRARRPRDQKGH